MQGYGWHSLPAWWEAPRSRRCAYPYFSTVRTTRPSPKRGGVTVLLPRQLQLNDFTVEHYPNGTPRHFFAEISIDGKPARLEVNHPYAASWGEQYYLTSYDMQSGRPQYCVVQIVREPLKYLMLAGIIMMLCGACLLFLAGPNVQKNGPSETSRPRETYNKCVQG